MSRVFTIFVVTVLIVILPVMVFGAEPITPECDVYVNGKLTNPCTVNHLLKILENTAKWILGVIGSVALILFVYGGFLWVTAAGNSGRVEQGRNIIVGTVVGIIIVLGAYTGVRFIANNLGDTGGASQFLGGNSSGSSECRSEGDACSQGGANVFACGANGSCSAQTLCAYWATKGGGPYSLTTAHRCSPITNCNASTVQRNLCNGDASIVCCTP